MRRKDCREAFLASRVKVQLTPCASEMIMDEGASGFRRAMSDGPLFVDPAEDLPAPFDERLRGRLYRACCGWFVFF